VIVMDRENLWFKGWSHVLSTTNDLDELRAFCVRVGAPAAALQLGNRRWPHLDLRSLPRERALACADVRVFERTCDMLSFLKALPVQEQPTAPSLT
jgi:hypothetical protein